MIKAPDGVQDLRRKIYAKAKAEAHWRFWGLYVHICKWETLDAAYAMARSNDCAFRALTKSRSRRSRRSVSKLFSGRYRTN